jgi:hypothetical protein
MSVPAPDWVSSFEGDKSDGVDLLGLRAPVQALGNELFDGVTTVTPRLRYMSVISWAVWRYAQARLPEDRSSFFEFTAAQESAFVMANRSKNRSLIQLVGAKKANEELDTDKKKLKLQRLTQNIAFDIYVASSRQLNLTKRADSGLNKLSDKRGEALAKEFDKVLQGTAYGKRLAKNPRIATISRDELDELAGPMSIVSIPRGERNILIDVIMPSEPIDPAERRRLRNYALLLWLGQTNERAVNEADVFDAAQHPPEGLPNCLAATIDGWLAYVVRDCLAVCHEAVFAAVMRYVDRVYAMRRAPAFANDAIVTLVAAAAEKDEALRSFHLLKKGETADGVSFRTVFDRVRNRYSKGRTVTNGLARWVGGLSETELYDYAGSSDDAAVALLPVAWCLALERVPPGSAHKTGRYDLSRAGEVFQIGIADVVRPKVEEFLQHDRSYRDVMAELVLRTVQQHLRVAWKRFSLPRGKDVSVLIADTEAWSRNNGFNAGRTGSRLPVAIDWLGQLLLTSEEGLTKTGERVLKRSLDTLKSS